MGYMLEIQNIHKTFNPGTINEKVALNGVNLNLNPGDFVTIIGGNGAGKSSLIQMITTALYGVNDATDSKGSGLDKCINTDCDYFQLEFCLISRRLGCIG